MRRLTPKKEIRDKIKFSDDWQTNEICLKYGDIEDVEEELGVDIVTLFKALFNNGEFFFKDNNKIKSIRDDYYVVHILGDCSFEIIKSETIAWCKFSDYGKTWALTEKELKGDK